MAIEDAAVLANCLGSCTGEDVSGIPAALTRYTRLRRGRVDRVRRAAQRQGRIYHLRGPMALTRDLVIRAMGPQRMLARQDWIYGWRA
jgi:salicylate hydroxylase